MLYYVVFMVNKNKKEGFSISGRTGYIFVGNSSSQTKTLTFENPLNLTRYNTEIRNGKKYLLYERNTWIILIFLM